MEQREIERKFLVRFPLWREETDGTPMDIEQVYLANTPDVALRISKRSIQTDTESVSKACINIKTPRDGLVRHEVELELDWLLACELVRNLKDKYPSIEKTRHFIPIDGVLKWEIDVFKNKGLEHIEIAEVELPFEDYPDFKKPLWIGEEVTNDPQYCNAVMAETHFVKRPVLTSKEIDSNFMDNWSFLLKEDGSVNIDLLKYELSDFSHLINEVPKIYDHIAGLSKHMYFASTINSLADERYWESHKEMILDDIEEMTEIQEVIDYLRG